MLDADEDKKRVFARGLNWDFPIVQTAHTGHHDDRNVRVELYVLFPNREVVPMQPHVVEGLDGMFP